MQFPDIEAWERQTAEAEALEIRETVRIALCSGPGSPAALTELRRRMARLTTVQREIVIDALSAHEEPAGR